MMWQPQKNNLLLYRGSFLALADWSTFQSLANKGSLGGNFYWLFYCFDEKFFSKLLNCIHYIEDTPINLWLEVTYFKFLRVTT